MFKHLLPHKGPWRVNRRRGVHKRRRAGFWASAREYIWPTMGMRAFARWMMVSLQRQAGKPHFVALGFACGIWTAFFPLLGTHILVIWILCWLLRASFLAALAGTMLGNPWTYGPIWASGYRVGAKILQMPKGSAHSVIHQLHWETLGHDLGIVIHDVILPTLLGGVVLGLPVALFFYFVVYWQIKLWRTRRVGK